MESRVILLRGEEPCEFSECKEVDFVGCEDWFCEDDIILVPVTDVEDVLAVAMALVVVGLSLSSGFSLGTSIPTSSEVPSMYHSPSLSSCKQKMHVQYNFKCTLNFSYEA